MANRVSGSSAASGAGLDPDRSLALVYAPAAYRAPLETLWMLDAALGALVAGGGQSLITQIKLAWWREALTALDDRDPPAEPMLMELAKTVLPAGITGTAISEMALGWEFLLTPDPLSEDELSGYAKLRGGTLFRLSARLLGCEGDSRVEAGGEGWALADLARRSSRPDERAAALMAARSRLADRNAWPRPLRPLGMLAALARRDAERGGEAIEAQGAPVRMLRMLRHRLTGR